MPWTNRLASKSSLDSSWSTSSAIDRPWTKPFKAALDKWTKMMWNYQLKWEIYLPFREYLIIGTEILTIFREIIVGFAEGWSSYSNGASRRENQIRNNRILTVFSLTLVLMTIQTKIEYEISSFFSFNFWIKSVNLHLVQIEQQQKVRKQGMLPLKIGEMLRIAWWWWWWWDLFFSRWI